MRKVKLAVTKPYNTKNRAAICEIPFNIMHTIRKISSLRVAGAKDAAGRGEESLQCPNGGCYTLYNISG
jgi:hypothetical protein